MVQKKRARSEHPPYREMVAEAIMAEKGGASEAHIRHHIREAYGDHLDLEKLDKVISRTLEKLVGDHELAHHGSKYTIGKQFDERAMAKIKRRAEQAAPEEAAAAKGKAKKPVSKGKKAPAAEEHEEEEHEGEEAE